MITKREIKLVFNEPAVADDLARHILSLRSIMGCHGEGRMVSSRIEDAYWVAGETGVRANPMAMRMRGIDGNSPVPQEKRLETAVGNERRYATREPASCPRGVPGLHCSIDRMETAFITSQGPVTVRFDTCRYREPGGAELGVGHEMELLADPSCLMIDPLADHLCAAFAMRRVTRSKLTWGLSMRRPDAQNPRKVILDMDPGADDAIALMLATASPELEILALTTVAGNVSLAQTTLNARCLAARAAALHEASGVPPVARGLEPPGELPDASDVHGPTGLGDYDHDDAPVAPLDPRAAPDLIADLLDRYPGEVVLVATGPLTNLAACARLRPGSLAKARQIIAMGGSFFGEGNRSPSAEFNIHRDPGAAEAVLRFTREHGLDLVFVGLDVTHRVSLFRHDLAASGHPAAGLIDKITARYFRFHEENEGLPGCHLHDPLAVALLLDPSLCEVERYPVSIETGGSHAPGTTIADTRPTRLYANDAERVTGVCVTVDSRRARELILGRVLPGWTP